jgi:hypothetical protein
MKFLVFIFSLLLIFSCSDLSRGTQLKTVVSLRQTVDSVETVLIENTLEEVDRYFKDAKIVESRIKENYNSDTISLELATKIDRYKEMIKNTLLLKRNYGNIISDVEKLQLNLEHLQEDIDLGNGDRSKYDEYLVKEQKNVQLVRGLLIEYVSTRKEIIDNYKNLHDDVYNFSFDLITN